MTLIKNSSFYLLTAPDDPEFTQSLQCPQGSSGDVQLPELRCIPPICDFLEIGRANYAQLTVASLVNLLYRGKIMRRRRLLASATQSLHYPTTSGKRSSHSQMIKTERTPDIISNVPRIPARSQIRNYRRLWAARNFRYSAMSSLGSLRSREAIIFLLTLARPPASLRTRIIGTGSV